MPIYLEMPHLNPAFPFKFLINDGNILTTPHWHKEYELLWIIKGEANLGINDQQFHLKANEIAFFNSGDIHYVVATPDSQRYVYQFDLTFFSEATVQGADFDFKTMFSTTPRISRHWSEIACQQLRHILKQLAQEEQHPDQLSPYAIRALLFRLLVVMGRDIDHQEVTQTHLSKIRSQQILETLNQVFAYVEHHYAQPLTLDDAANSVNLSRYYFARWFKKNVGKTFMEFLNDYRLDKVKWALINSETSITDILGNTGFNSSKTFYRLFKQKLRTTPRAYRQQHKLD